MSVVKNLSTTACLSKASGPVASSPKRAQHFDSFLVLDFEATCDHPVQTEPMEIIEFPVLMVNAISFEVEASFHTFVRPQVNTQLSSFCTKMTGIIQQTVDSSPTLEVVLKRFDEWVREEACLICPQTGRNLKRFSFATCGNWDLQMMLQDQCSRLKIPIPHYMRTWINVKKSFATARGRWPKSQIEMMDELKVKPVGRQHSGVDDCKNLIQVMKQLVVQDDFVFTNTNQMWA